MSNIIEGTLQGEGIKVGIVVSRFNDFLTSRLLSGAVDGLVRHGVEDKAIDVVKVPGSFEIPFAAKQMVSIKQYDAVICLGAVIRGGTPHFEYVASEVTKGVALIALESGVPVIFGVLTVDTIEQGIERSGAKSGNKGWDAALSAIEMVSLVKKMGTPSQDK